MHPPIPPPLTPVLPGYAPVTIAINVTHIYYTGRPAVGYRPSWKEDSMLVKRLAAYTHLGYLQPFLK